MSVQGNLFSNAVAKRQEPTPTKAIPDTSRRFEFKRIPKPWGEPDKKGKYAYERFQASAEKIDEKARVAFFKVLQTTDADTVANMVKIGVLWEKLNALEQQDYEEAIRLRG